VSHLCREVSREGLSSGRHYLLYAADVIPLIEDCGVSVHAYADDLQVYGRADATQSAQLLTQMADCIARVEVWMARNRLRLNSSKIELIWLGSPRRLRQCTPDAMIVSGASIKPSQASEILDFLLVFIEVFFVRCYG